MRNLSLVGIVAATLLGVGGPGDSPIADAAMRGDSAQVRALIKQGADVNAAQGDGMTALHWAASRGDLDEARMLVVAGARLDATTRNGNYTPLHLAARSGKPSIVKALLAAGANPNAVTNTGGATPLHFAASEGTPESVSALLDKGAVANARDSAFGQTPLMWAAASNRADAIRVLASRGGDLAATSQRRQRAEARQHGARGDAAVHAPHRGDARRRQSGGRGGGGARPSWSAEAVARCRRRWWRSRRSGRWRAGRRPRRAGGDSARALNGRGLSFGELVGNKGGLTALLYAVREGNVEATTALLKAGADINQVSAGDHSSPLLIATINGHFDLAKVLLDRGANPKLASDAGATPLYATINMQWIPKASYPQPAARHSQTITYLALMEELLNKGADPNVRLTKHLWYMSYIFDLLGVNTAGATPFWRAAYGLDVPAMKLLVAHGADPMIPTLKPVGTSAEPGRARGVGLGGEERIRQACRRCRSAARASTRSTRRPASATATASRRTRTSTRPTRGCRR